jgi:hypothetical protein
VQPVRCVKHRLSLARREVVMWVAVALSEASSEVGLLLFSSNSVWLKTGSRAPVDGAQRSTETFSTCSAVPV